MKIIKNNKFGNFDDLNSFASYFEVHYKPMLEELSTGKSKLTDRHKRLLGFLLDDISAIANSQSIESSKKFVKSAKSAMDCFPVSEEEAKDIDNLKETFENKADLRAVLEDYFHVYDDWAEITPTEFDKCFKEFIGSAFFEQGKECVVEINENGKWEMVSLDNTPEGWSTKKAAKIFPDENTARKSALIKRLASAGYSESNGNLRFSER